MDIFAFSGTGTCDPNKDLKQLFAFAMVVAFWAMIVFIIRIINRSGKANIVKIALSALLVLAGIVASVVIFLASFFYLACSV